MYVSECVCQRTFFAPLMHKEPCNERRIDQKESKCRQRDANYDQIWCIAGVLR